MLLPNYLYINYLRIMVKHTFFEKCCTIFKDSDANTGLNPVAELNYGNNISRVLIYFSIDDIKTLYQDKTICDRGKVKHILRMTNCGSVNNDIHNETLFDGSCNKKERASSCDVLLLKVPKFWDGGKGVDYVSDFWNDGAHIYSNLGCNWYQRVNGGKWEEEGVYSSKTIENEYEKFNNNETSLVVGETHFDIGNEIFEFDITDYVNKLINEEEKNNGLLLCFHPSIENLEMETQQYIGFFTNHTNTFFRPYLETICEDPIKDDRKDFHIGKTNRLYLYCHKDGNFFNLDELPNCTINGIRDIIVKQQRKGVYYAEFSIKKGSVEVDTILYDMWSNLVLNGEKLEDKEYEFVVKQEKDIFSNKRNENKSYFPSITGIIPDEKIRKGEIREMEILFRKKYTTNICEVFDNCYYRLYVKDGANEIDIIEWDSIDKMYLSNNILIDTNNLIPNDYFMDIKKGNEYYRDVLRFKVI